ncbi:MAG: hypothetical protein M1828_004911 [Chrysothrix sp. TS-e1954]|nr:MAG: hypothetical protein M1828_004911 [Chrysothrix sp. TS-e1954]
MNVNKKFDRFRQWGREKMGAEVQTGTTQDFKALETEMNLRHEGSLAQRNYFCLISALLIPPTTGMDKLHSSMNTYVKSLNKRTEGEGRDKNTPIGYLGQQMTLHGEDFEDGNTFGQCLASFGQANEKVARLQETYATSATDTWLASVERGVAQMKEYQAARKRMDSRRLALDTAQGKMQKAKRDDYRAEEEARAQKAKFEESSEEVSRRMQDIVEAEHDSVGELYGFLEAEITYHDKCREILMNLRADWPTSPPAQPTEPPRPATSRSASRTTTLSRVPTSDSLSPSDIPTMPPRPYTARTTSNTSTPAFPSRTPTPLQSYDLASKPTIARSTTTDLPSTTKPFTQRPPVPRIATEASVSRAQLRPIKRDGGASGAVLLPDEGDTDESPDRSSSPVSSYGTGNGTISRNTSWSTLDARAATITNGGTTGSSVVGAAKKAPPPPPPSRASKPRPPPPPPPMMKRGVLSS